MDSVELAGIEEMENFLKRVSGREEARPDDKKTLDGILKFLHSVKRGIYFVDEVKPETANEQDVYLSRFLLNYTKINLKLAERAIERYLETSKAIKKGDGLDRENVKDLAGFIGYIRRQKGSDITNRSRKP